MIDKDAKEANMSALGRLRTAVMISGRGSNLGALLRAAEDPAYPAEISLVISNDEHAGGLLLARNAGVPTAIFSNRTYGKDRPSQERDMHGCLVGQGIDLVVLAGYMRVLSVDFVGRWQGRMINIHPSLLPKYPGLHTHERALEAGDTEHGCTVHWVIAELDAGPIISQAMVPIIPGDNAETLAARVLVQEHILLPQVLAKVAMYVAAGNERISSVALLGPGTSITYAATA
jgi:phosphoribosylglycinamide formyltransferase-1